MATKGREAAAATGAMAAEANDCVGRLERRDDVPGGLGKRMMGGEDKDQDPGVLSVCTDKRSTPPAREARQLPPKSGGTAQHPNVLARGEIMWADPLPPILALPPA